MPTTALTLATSAFTTSAMAQSWGSSSGRWSQKAYTTGMSQTGWYPLTQSVTAFGVTLLFMPIASFVSIPELTKRGYPESLILGTLAGSATLGLLIPPSIVPIVYALRPIIDRPPVHRRDHVNHFVRRIHGRARMNGPRPDPHNRSAVLRRQASRRLIPVALLIGRVIGSIYGGLSSPTDAAALGVVLATLLAWFSGSVSWHLFGEAVMSATHLVLGVILI